MTTVLKFGNSNGMRRCDAQCHDAIQDDCDCICGGRFHGKGVKAVMRMIEERGDKIIKAINTERSVQFAPVQKTLGI